MLMIFITVRERDCLVSNLSENMKKAFVLIILVLMVLTGCQKKVSGITFSDLTVIQFDELDQKIANKETMVVYFGWVSNCPDSRNIQENYIQPLLDQADPTLQNMVIVDLDLIIPDALANKELRKPMYEKYQVQFGPTIIYYVDGEIKEMIEWTAANGDEHYGINKDLLDRFFEKVKIN